MSDKTNRIQQELTQAVIDSMTNTPDTWTKPWQGISGSPRNPVTGTVYSGGNRMILTWLSPDGDPRWSTYKGWGRIDAQVRKGETGTPIMYLGKSLYNSETGKWKGKDTGNLGDEWAARSVWRAYTVFHASQVDGAPEWSQPVVSPDINVDTYRAWFQSIGADWREGPGDMAYYHPTEDFIFTPEDTQFAEVAGWFATVAHEHTHWTGHTDRTGRSGDKRVEGRSAYAFEELVAELGAVFLCNQQGISADPRPDHAKYIQNWLKALQDDRTFVWQAASKASKAVDYLTGAAEAVPEIAAA
jgi:antirestriction protein ArdC